VFVRGHKRSEGYYQPYFAMALVWQLSHAASHCGLESCTHETRLHITAPKSTLCTGVMPESIKRYGFESRSDTDCRDRAISKGELRSGKRRAAANHASKI
jgi:hypothetical protein